MSEPVITPAMCYENIAAQFKLLAQLAAAPAQPSAPAADEPKKRGRPAAKVETPADAPPQEDDKTVTSDHPKRAELKAVAKEYAALDGVGREKAQTAMKLFAESSSLVPDADLAGAVVHFKNLIKQATKKATPPPADDDSI
jgi:hypothetical protein